MKVPPDASAKTHTPGTAADLPRQGRSGARRRGLVNTVFLIPALVFLAVFSLYPMYVLAQMSIAQVGVKNLLAGWPFVGGRNFAAVLGDPTFRAVALQTLVLVAGIVITTLFAGLISAYILRAETRFNAITQTFMILIWVLPPVIVGSLWKFLLASNGFFNSILKALHLIDEPIAFLAEPGVSLASVAMVMLWTGLPFSALVLRSAMLDVPTEVIDAAQVDGAGQWQTAVRIVIPMIRPTIITLAVLVLVGAFKTFDLIYVMTKGGPGTSTSTIPYLAYTTAFTDFRFDLAAAMSVLAMIIVLVFAAGYVWAVRREERS